MENTRLVTWLLKNKFTMKDFTDDPKVCVRYVAYIRKKAGQFKRKYCVLTISKQDQNLFDEFLNQR
jgi:hypothetical protein